MASGGNFSSQGLPTMPPALSLKTLGVRLPQSIAFFSAAVKE